MPTWDNLNQAFQYLQRYLANKSVGERFVLSEIDLALVSNFKGGSASVVEPVSSLTSKLDHYSQKPGKLHNLIRGRAIYEFQHDLAELQQEAMTFWY
jgi:hypothetical protein